jgi:nitroreductase/FMN reductase [NAD(P)H]
MTKTSVPELRDLMQIRFGGTAGQGASVSQSGLLGSMLARGSCRAFQDRAVPADLLDVLCAAALASPTKSDLQQRDIVLLRSAEARGKLAQLVRGQAWVAQAPMIAVFCGNNRRQRLVHDWHQIPFANDHLDAFFNAAADAAIALGAFVTAAEASGLGCCPISAVRNEAQAVSDVLDLPRHVFPFAGLAIGYPAAPPQITKRLPMDVTCHIDTYSEQGLRRAVQAYDADRAAVQPYATQRFTATFGACDGYGWSQDKARQYSQPERDGFGAYVRARGFCLD